MKHACSYLLLACALLCGACRTDLVDEEPDPQEANGFQAEVTGAINASIAGTLAFDADNVYDGSFIELDSSYAGGRYVQILLQAEGSSDVIRLVQFGEGLAATTYPITFMPSLEGPPYSFAAFLNLAVDGGVKTLRATSGTLTLTTFSAERIEGTFTFAGLVDGEAVNVAGTFEATRQ